MASCSKISPRSSSTPSGSSGYMRSPRRTRIRSWLVYSGYFKWWQRSTSRSSNEQVNKWGSWRTSSASSSSNQIRYCNLMAPNVNPHNHARPHSVVSSPCSARRKTWASSRSSSNPSTWRVCGVRSNTMIGTYRASSTINLQRGMLVYTIWGAYATWTHWCSSCSWSRRSVNLSCRSRTWYPSPRMITSYSNWNACSWHWSIPRSSTITLRDFVMPSRTSLGTIPTSWSRWMWMNIVTSWWTVLRRPSRGRPIRISLNETSVASSATKSSVRHALITPNVKNPSSRSR